jgi:hypothetical protein
MSDNENTWKSDDVQDPNDLNLEGFDPEKIEVQAFDPIPDGWYPMIVEKVTIKDTKPKEDGSKPGKIANFQLKVTEGEHKGRVVFEALNIRNSSETAQRIAWEQLSAMFKACGKGGNNLSVLVQCECMVRIKTEPAQNGYDAKNKVARNGYKAIVGTTPAEPQSVAAPSEKKVPGFIVTKKTPTTPSLVK